MSAASYKMNVMISNSALWLDRSQRGYYCHVKLTQSTALDRLRVDNYSPPFFLRDSRASETRARVEITPPRQLPRPPRVAFSCVGWFSRQLPPSRDFHASLPPPPPPPPCTSGLNYLDIFLPHAYAIKCVKKVNFRCTWGSRNVLLNCKKVRSTGRIL